MNGCIKKSGMTRRQPHSAVVSCAYTLLRERSAAIECCAQTTRKPPGMEREASKAEKAAVVRRV